MGYYKVNFGDYCLAHHTDCKYLNYFEFKGKKYPIGAHVNLTKYGEYYMFNDRGYGFIRGNFRLVSHFIDSNGVEKWEYIIGKLYDSNVPCLKYTTKTPDELIAEVKCVELNEMTHCPDELKVEFQDFNFSPKDYEVEGMMTGWLITAIIWVGAFMLKDWWLKLIVQIFTVWCFGSWREKKINEAITKQKFKH